MSFGVLLLFSSRFAKAAGVFWDTGNQNPVLLNGVLTHTGYLAGEILSVNRPNRWHAVPIIVPTGGVSITNVEFEWLIQPGYEAANVRLKVLNRTNLNAPNNAGLQVADILLGSYGPGTDDPRINGVDDWLHSYDLSSSPLVLNAGNYWLIPYAQGDVDPMFPTQDHAIAHFAGAWGASEVDPLEQTPTGSFPNGFMWRSTNWPSPGFQSFDGAGAILPSPGNQLENVDTYNFNMLLEASNVPNATMSGNAVLNDIDASATSYWDTFVAEIRDANNNVLKYQPFVLNNALAYNPGTIYNAPFVLNYAVPNRVVSNIRIKGGTFLAKTVPATPGIQNISFINGDWDGDNELTLVDYGAVAAAFGTIQGDPAFDAFADFNLDGEINLFDVAIVSGNFGMAGDE